MVLTPKGYKERLLDRTIQKKLLSFGAISIEGPKWCGKTWTVLNNANSIVYMMKKEMRLKAELDISTALVGEHPHGIDEWQEVPEIWDEVRFTVDHNTLKGQFLLTGSVSPPKDKIRHSGVGRFVRVKMRPMSLFESGDSTGRISLSDLFDGEKVALEESKTSVDELIDITCRGGWPASVQSRLTNPGELSAEYIEGIISGDIIQDSTGFRDTEKFKFFLSSLARNNATIVKNTTIHNDVQKAAGEFSSKTLAKYLQILRDIYLLEEIPGWHPQIRSKTRILSTPKRMLVDPSLAIASLGATSDSLKKDLVTYGGLFEGLCLRDLLIYAESIDAKVFHYRDDSLLEVDAIIEKPGGYWGAIEIKLGGSGIDKGAKSLLALRKKMMKAGINEPAYLVVLTANGLAMTRDDGVQVIPITILKD